MVSAGIYMPLESFETPQSISNKLKLVEEHPNEKMIGKFLFIAIASVAFAQVPEDDIKSAIQEGLKQLDIIYHKKSDSIHNALDVLIIKGDLDCTRLVEAHWGKISDVLDVETGRLENNTRKITEFAKMTNRPQSVFTCINDMQEKALENVLAVRWSMTTQMNIEDGSKREERHKMGEKFYDALDVYVGEYHSTVKELKKCETLECIKDIIEEYYQDYVDLDTDFKETVEVIEAEILKFRANIDAIFKSSRKAAAKARGTGITAIKSCLIKIN